MIDGGIEVCRFVIWMILRHSDKSSASLVMGTTS